jgi:hypothetical protein
MRVALCRIVHFRANSFLIVCCFTFCQVIGAMCILTDVVLAVEQAKIAEEGMVCPMDSGIMCPTSLTSSPDRQIKIGTAPHSNHLTFDSGEYPGTLVRAVVGGRDTPGSPPLPSHSLPSLTVLRI